MLLDPTLDTRLLAAMAADSTVDLTVYVKAGDKRIRG